MITMTKVVEVSVDALQKDAVKTLKELYEVYNVLFLRIDRKHPEMEWKPKEQKLLRKMRLITELLESIGGKL